MLRRMIRPIAPSAAITCSTRHRADPPKHVRPAFPGSLAQFTGGFGGAMPGRSRGTQTRSAPGRIVHSTGVGIDTASPSMPTGSPATQSSSKMQSGSVAAIRVRAYACPPSFGAAPGRSLSPGAATHNDQSVPPADHSCRGEISGSHGVCRRLAQRACPGAHSRARDGRSLGRLGAADPDLAGGSVSVAVALTAAAAWCRSSYGCSARPGRGRRPR